MLSSEKCIFWKDHELLIVSDLHFGKAGHFRKSGIPVPAKVHLGDLNRLSMLIEFYLPKKVVFLGDLFHSDYNIDWEYFCEWTTQYVQLEFILVKGNHDILYGTDYKNANLEVVEELILGEFSLTHEQKETSHYNLSGHVHPSVRLRGAARQTMTLPCFYFGNDYGYLPAFGAFTGYVSIDLKKGDHVYVIADDGVLKM